MSKLFKFMTIAAVGVAIGTVASKFARSDKPRITRDTQPASESKNQPNAEKNNGGDTRDMNDLDNCFI